MTWRPFIISILLATGCTATRQLPVPDPDPPPARGSAAEVLGRLPAADSLWAFFRVDARLSYSAPQGRGTVSAEIHARPGDTVYVTLRAPLGIEVGRALVTRDSIHFHDRVAGVLYSGDRDSGLLPAGWQAARLGPAFFGFDPPEGGDWQIESDSGLVRLERAGGRETLLVDPSLNRITLHDVRDGTGTVVESRRYTDFERFAGRWLPRRIVTMRPAEEARASFQVRNVEPEPAGTPVPFVFAADLERIQVR